MRATGQAPSCCTSTAANGGVWRRGKPRVTSGGGEKGTGEDGLAATDTALKLPYGVEYVGGRLHISDTGNNMIRTLLLP